MKKHMKIIKILIVAFFVAAPNISYSKDKFPPSSLFTSPPYDEFTLGTKPEIDVQYKSLPKFIKGDVVAYYLTHDGKIKHATCNKELNVSVEQPVGIHKIGEYVHTSGMDIKQSIQKVRGAVFNESKDASSSSSNSVKSNISSSSSSSHTVKSGVKSIGQKRQSSSISGALAVRATEAGSSNAKTTKNEKKLQSISGKSSLNKGVNKTTKVSTNTKASALNKGVNKTTKVSAKDKASTLKKGVSKSRKASTVTSSGRLSDDVSSSKLVWSEKQWGRFGKFKDFEGLYKKIDSEKIPEYITSSEMLDYVSKSERALFARMYKKWIVFLRDIDNQTIKKMLEGFPTKEQRKDYKNLKGKTSKLELSCLVTPNSDTLSHGGSYAIKFIIDNKGQVPLFDVMLALRTPDNSFYLTEYPKSKYPKAPQFHVGRINKERQVVRLFTKVPVGRHKSITLVNRTNPWSIDNSSK